MADRTLRDLLKQGIKLWFVTSERVRSTAAQLREDLEDVVVEARHEYEDRAAAPTAPEAERDAPVATPPRRKAGRGRSTSKVDERGRKHQASA